jgi:SAM-dependent methyltransferase
MTSRAWLPAGLGFTTFATLLVEILDARLLSVLTWYHLSFFAVSLAMLGMAAGAVLVFLGGPRFTGTAAVRALTRHAWHLALSIPLLHVLALQIRIPEMADGMVLSLAALAVVTILLAVPFVLSGVVVAIALTRVGGQVGVLYGWDLVGAAAGALAVVPLLEWLDLTSVMLLAGAAAALGTVCFARFSAGAGAGRFRRRAAVLAAALVVAAGFNAGAGAAVRVRYSKGRPLPLANVVSRADWNSHSFVVVQRPASGTPVYWGPGAQASQEPVALAWMVIDGEAATAMTEWRGDRAALAWAQHDVTSLPHHLRQGRAAIIGVGGGRDVLSALWAGHWRIVGIEINGVLVDLLARSHRGFAGVADDPAVELVHDEARSYLRRSDERFDVIQMSLIDTWAATGAGAFTLSENGLYTREAWQVFLDSLTPDGIFSVSRWFNPSDLSETNRLLALGVAALLDRGVADPRSQIVLFARGPIATLLVSASPFTSADRIALDALARAEAFEPLVSPWHAGAIARLERIAASGSPEALSRATADGLYDFSPPTDQRPYFFNILKPGLGMAAHVPERGIAWGNLSATMTLAALCVVATLLVFGIIVWPLAAAGRPDMPAGTFAASLMYFAFIGSGYMFVQIPFLQRFSVLLGHPTYTFAIVLFSMILFTGLGSFLSERLSVESGASGRLWLLPVLIGLALMAVVFAIEPAARVASGFGLPGRTLVVLAFTAPLSLLLGCCFPIGMRLVGRLSDTAAAWLWGVNGACGVLASVFAVAVSMWVGIDTNLMLAAALYVALLVPLTWLARSPGQAGVGLREASAAARDIVIP